MIPGGLHEDKLFNELVDIFGKLTANAEKFSVGVSSNVNASLNASVASKAPKSKCLSKTASSDIGFTCVVSEKNIGPSYKLECNKSKSFSPGRHHSRFVSRIDKIKTKRKLFQATKEYKSRRMQLKKYRAALRHQRERTEGVTYESNCTLLTEKGVEQSSNDDLSEEEGTVNKDVPIVYLDLETSGYHRSCEILQIAAKCGKFKYNEYVTPTKQISPAATAIHGLRKYEADLMLHGKKFESVSLRIAVSNLFEFLKSLNKQCYIAAHNSNFDGPRLIDAITACNLHDEFENRIVGFMDTLTVIKFETLRTGKGECTLTGLAKWLKISNFDAHNACQDVIILEKIIKKAEITYESLSSAAKKYDELKKKWNNDKFIQEMLPSLQSMNNVTSLETRKKLITAGIIIQRLTEAYSTSDSAGEFTLLSTKINGKPMIHKRCIQKIVEWLSKQ